MEYGKFVYRFLLSWIAFEVWNLIIKKKKKGNMYVVHFESTH